MRRFNTLFAAAAMAAGLTFAGAVQAADPAAPVAPTDNPPVGQRIDDAARNTVDNTGKAIDNTMRDAGMKPAADANDIRKSVASVTETAITKGDYAKLTRHFVDADHERLSKYKAPDNFAKLDGRLDQFNKDWKAKYNQDFSFTKASKDVLNDQFARIVAGEIGEARTAAGKEMPSATPQNVTGGTAADLEKSGVNKPDANSTKTGGGDTNREPGRNIATVILTAPAGIRPTAANPMPGTPPMANANKELAVPLIHELPDSWRVDVPDSLDGQRLYDNLVKHLTMVDEDRANWPADVNDAYRVVTYHVFQALFDTGSNGM